MAYYDPENHETVYVCEFERALPDCLSRKVFFIIAEMPNEAKKLLKIYEQFNSEKATLAKKLSDELTPIQDAENKELAAVDEEYEAYRTQRRNERRAAYGSPPAGTKKELLDIHGNWQTLFDKWGRRCSCSGDWETIKYYDELTSEEISTKDKLYKKDNCIRVKYNIVKQEFKDDHSLKLKLVINNRKRSLVRWFNLNLKNSIAISKFKEDAEYYLLTEYFGEAVVKYLPRVLAEELHHVVEHYYFTEKEWQNKE